ncbi:phenylacetate--CoA ligase family protein [Tritonibacter mobilis]|uniref:phenylacetate--CoA ligase family protein n=1 Tax=Tritonibacter mobilis TaxID=379347 RepID=UPI000E0D2A1B|nr:phenylacetate--CoA ligase family protein [Tritonibacter mobilis]
MTSLLSYENVFRKLYPVYRRMIGRDGQAVLHERRQTQYLPLTEIEAIQLVKLKRVLESAAEHVPYYREEFSRIGFVPADLKSLEEFSAVDFFIDKAIVRDNVQDFLADNRTDSDLNWHKTGGSTGTPLNFPTDKPTDAASASAIMKALDWWDIELGARHAMFWGSPSFIRRKRTDIFKQWANVVRNRLMNRLFFLNYDIGEHNVHKIHAQLERFQPEYIRGMPTSLAVFAKLAKKEGLVLDKGRPKFVHSACEQLFDWQQNIIEEVFRAPVVNTYGLSEVGDIAYGAPCGNLHTMDEDILLELFDYIGSEKEIVTTQLNNMASPLIRYRTGDIAANISPCTCNTCNLNSKTIQGLRGRAHDFILSPSGKFLHGQFLTHIIVYEPGIRKYQVNQKSTDSLNIKLVIDEGYDEACQARIRSAIQSYMGDEVSIEFSIVDEIPLTAAGKYRWIVSDLGPLDEHI